MEGGRWIINPHMEGQLAVEKLQYAANWEKTCRLQRVSHLIDKSANAWDEAAVRSFFYTCDVEEILKIKIPSIPCPDWFAWNYEKAGIFTVRSAYRVALR
jgi:hypothetical protein